MNAIGDQRDETQDNEREAREEEDGWYKRL
jgi:hypothetical protein